MTVPEGSFGMKLNEVEQLALQLDAADRERLGVRLLAGVASPALGEVEQAWVDEAERRLDELLAGAVEGIEGDRFISTVKRDLGWT